MCFIEYKLPFDDPLANPKVLGQAYDYLRLLSSTFGVEEAFGIAATYEETIIVWLDNTNPLLKLQFEKGLPTLFIISPTSTLPSTTTITLKSPFGKMPSVMACLGDDEKECLLANAGDQQSRKIVGTRRYKHNGMMPYFHFLFKSDFT